MAKEEAYRLTINGDVVVVIDHNEAAQTKVAGNGGGLRGDALLQAPVTHKDISVVVEELIAGLVEAGSKVGLGNGKTNRVGDALTEGARGHLNTGKVVLRMTGSAGGMRGGGGEGEYAELS